MEADWEIDIGGDAPVIDAYWSGLVDLRATPDRAFNLAETRLQPGLADTLARLNSESSPAWSSKCDVFEPEPMDASELEAVGEEAAYAQSCYIDMLPREEHDWNTLAAAEQACRQLCGRLRLVPLRCCRVDLVIRHAMLRDRQGLGITAYLTGCGSNKEGAVMKLEQCMDVFAEAITNYDLG